jgi:hypothetical protein
MPTKKKTSKVEIEETKVEKIVLTEKEELDLAAQKIASEEEMDDLEEAALSLASAGSPGVEIAQNAISSAEASGSLKNFRHHPDMENFYRFIYENDLRLEALVILDEMLNAKRMKRATKTAKIHAH